MGHAHAMAGVRPAQHVIGLDLLRLAAAMSVLFFHLGSASMFPGVEIYSGGILGFPEISSAVRFGRIGVQAFFVISGFVIFNSAASATANSFLAARILRLGPAVWICAPITAICIYLSGTKPPLEILHLLMKSMTFYPLGAQIDGAYWTLAVEICFYAAIFVLLFLNRPGLFVVYICCMGFLSSAYYYGLAVGIFVTGTNAKWMGFLLIRHGCTFAFGAIVYLIGKQGLRWHTALFGLVTLAGCFLQLAPGLASGALPTEALVWAGFVAVFIVTVFINPHLHTICSPDVKRIIRTIGKATYPLYLIHQVVGAWIIVLLVTAGVNDDLALGGTTAFLLLLASVICMAEERLRDILRVPLFRMLRVDDGKASGAASATTLIRPLPAATDK